MAPPRQRTGLARRRRLDDEGDDVSVATEAADDSQSDASLPSDADDDADADNSDLSDAEMPTKAKGAKRPPKQKTNGGPRAAPPRPDVASRRAPSPPIARSEVAFTASRDTELMRNGITPADSASVAGRDDAVDFETGDAAAQPPSASPARQGTFAERRRREHDDYKKKRDADPSFIPNRGAFFMHDQRSAQGQNGFRQFGPRGGARGGRGGGAVGGPFSPANQRTQNTGAADAPWQHDLHETVAQPPAPQSQSQSQAQAQSQQQAPSRTSAPADASNPPPQHGPGQWQGQGHPVSAAPAAKQAPPPPRNFSTTVHTHNAHIRVFLPGMKEPKIFQTIAIKQHTRLPNHRPPLRRDKPVRISLPPAPPRYIFPTIERSFIFIPRALRPNQQGFGRGRGRGFGSFGQGFSSRRTSAYGGSVYSPSVAMSRRSSLAREMGRDTLVSPVGSVMSRPGGYVDPSRPVVVRMPPGGPRMGTAPPLVSPQGGTHAGLPPREAYPLPQKPAYRETWQGHLPIHQPRPQKTVSVAGIESPASLTFIPPQQQEQQPFHQQVPAHVNGNAPPADQPPYYQHTRQLSYPSQASNGTPLSNIPERAIHAPAFQPFQQGGFQPQPYGMGPVYYYPPNPAQQFVTPGGMVPVYAPQPGYAMPMAAPPAPAAPAPTGQSNLVAYESNGMTYYVDQAQLLAAAPVPPPPMEGYPQASYAVPGMGGMPTPSPEGTGYYYPQQAQQTMQPGAAVYYPPQ